MNPWFRNFRPITWQGWLAYVIMIAVVIYDYISVARVSESVPDTIFNFFPQAAVIFLLFALVIKAKREHGPQ